MKINDLIKVDFPLWECCNLLLDYIEINGTATELEIEEYLQFYTPAVRLYRVAALISLMEMGYIMCNAHGEYHI
jgi:hypothetical protein